MSATTVRVGAIYPDRCGEFRFSVKAGATVYVRGRRELAAIKRDRRAIIAVARAHGWRVRA